MACNITSSRFFFFLGCFLVMFVSPSALTLSVNLRFNKTNKKKKHLTGCNMSVCLALAHLKSQSITYRRRLHFVSDVVPVSDIWEDEAMPHPRWGSTRQHERTQRHSSAVLPAISAAI